MNNAGFVVGVEKVGGISADEVESMFATNVFGLIDMTQLIVNRQWHFVSARPSDDHSFILDHQTSKNARLAMSLISDPLQGASLTWVAVSIAQRSMPSKPSPVHS